MNDSVARYFGAIQAVLRDILDQEADNIRRVARVAADSISTNGVLHVYDTGHMLTSELIGRAGGLLAWSPLSFHLSVNNPNRHRDASPAPPPDDLPDVVRLAMKRSKVRKGDVLFVGSVSGKTPNPVEVALQGKGLGVTVVGVTGVEHSSELAAEHPSGLRLFEAADFVLNSHVPPGDALLDVDAFDRRVCPASGIAAACLMWAVNAGVAQCLVEMGIEPSVYQSVNLPGGPDNVRAIEARYAELGY